MSRLAGIVCLLFLTVSSAAQQRVVRVRLFWQHPPAVIHLVPNGATVRTCSTCAGHALHGAEDVKAQGENVIAEGMSSSLLLISGKTRLSGESFPSFATDGELRVESREGFLLLTLDMPLEKYVTAVLQGESAGFKSDEALKAMAVAARTYAVHFGSRHRLEGFDFCDTTHCQDMRLGSESARAQAAVEATEGELLWFEGRPAATYYHRSCGGELENASALELGLHAPYLREHHDEYCLRTPDEWHAELSKSELARALGWPVNAIRVASRSNSGRVQSLVLDGHPMSASDFRLAIGRALGWDKIRSDLYQLEDRGSLLSFRGRGRGHGVGLCQTGADNMGAEGHDYREILAFYYPGTSLGINAQGINWEKLPGESLDLLTTHREDAGELLPAAERALHFASQQTGWGINTRPQVKVYPTMDAYRDATGAPGWVAASTLGNVIRLQPIEMLQRTHALDSTLRHEFLHLLIESQARPGTPLWLREGLAIYLSNPDAVKPAEVDTASLELRLHSLKSEAEMRAAYRDSAAAVAEAIQKNGLSAVLSSLGTAK